MDELGAQLDEDEAAARGLAGTTWTARRLGDHDYEIWVTPEPLIHATAPTAGIADVQREDVAEWIAAHHPRRGLREVAAKRAILAEYERDPQADDQYRAGLAFALERLAEVYERG